MSSKDKIGASLESIRQLLDIESPNQNTEDSDEFAWYVGSTGNDDDGNWRDFSDEYIEKGIWINGYDDKYIEKVKSIQVGDKIALKSLFNQKHNLPFNANGKKVGAMKIKAIGIVTGNANDGKNITVDWTKFDTPKTWYGPGSLWNTIHYICASDGFIKKALLDFTFHDVPQDYSLCIDRYNEDEKDDEQIIETDENDVVDESRRLTGGINVILYGVPGAGKSWTIDHEYMDKETTMKKVVFHPDYTYSDFVGQILPKKVNDSISYDFVPGPFTKIMKDAYENPEKKFILAIEEINRGNAPAIFGDIFQLLDRDENGKSSYEIINADIARIVYGDENHVVYIPSNLSILCTMNTSDQNVFTLDTAFQRRWNMRLIENSFRKDSDEERKFAEHPILDSDIKWESFCSAINAQILEKNQNMTSSEDKRLGTHFVNLDDLNYYDEESATSDTEKLKIRLKNRRFPEKVIKYLWDDAFKFYRDEIFKAELNSLEKVIKVFTEKKKNDRFEIFKDNIRAAIFDENSKQ